MKACALKYGKVYDYNKLNKNKSDSNIDSTHIYISHERPITVLYTAYGKLQDTILCSCNQPSNEGFTQKL